MFLGLTTASAMVGSRKRPHPDKKRRFERARPNELWQTDLFTFVLKRQNRRLHLVGYTHANEHSKVNDEVFGPLDSQAPVERTLRQRTWGR